MYSKQFSGTVRESWDKAGADPDTSAEPCAICGADRETSDDECAVCHKLICPGCVVKHRLGEWICVDCLAANIDREMEDDE